MFKLRFTLVFFTLLIVFASSAFSQKDESLIAYWSFDEGKGDTVADQSGNGNDGTITGDVEWIDGKAGKALEFASGSCVTINDSDTMRDMDEYTIGMWIKMVELSPDWNHLFEKDGSYGITINTGGGDFRFTPNSSKVWIESKFKIEVDTWYYITMTATDSAIEFYVNANKESEAKEAIVYNNNPVNIAHSAGYNVNGAFDEVKMWSVALSPAEIKVAMEGNASVEPSNKLISTWANVKYGK